MDPLVGKAGMILRRHENGIGARNVERRSDFVSKDAIQDGPRREKGWWLDGFDQPESEEAEPRAAGSMTVVAPLLEGKTIGQIGRRHDRDGDRASRRREPRKARHVRPANAAVDARETCGDKKDRDNPNPLGKRAWRNLD